MKEDKKVLDAWLDLERLLERGYAVALSKIGKKFHARAVFQEKVVEATESGMYKVISSIVSSISENIQPNEVRDHSKR